jgi:hypothetical protein
MEKFARLVFEEPIAPDTTPERIVAMLKNS